MTVVDEDTIRKRCVAGAVALCFAHVLTVLGTDYQAYAKRHEFQFDPFHLIDYAFVLLVNYGIFLAPVVLLLLARNICIIVGIYAVPVLIFFVLRMHHVWQFYWFGINSMAVQKGDELHFFTLVFETISAGIAGLVLLIILSTRLVDRIQRVWRR